MRSGQTSPYYDHYSIEYYKDVLLEEAENLYNTLVDRFLCEVINENITKQLKAALPSPVQLEHDNNQYKITLY
jgi:hypothetical protein